MERNVHISVVFVEDRIEGRRVCLDRQFRRHAALLARIVAECLIRRQYELITDSKLPIRNDVGLPDGIACRVSVPLRVFLGWVAEEVDFVGWVIRVNIYSFVVDCPLDFIRRVFDTPKPIRLVNRRDCSRKTQKLTFHLHQRPTPPRFAGHIPTGALQTRSYIRRLASWRYRRPLHTSGRF